MEKEQIYIGEIGKHIMLKPIDKQDAIEVMAKALCKLASQGECKKNCNKCNIREAENALNQILPQAERFFTSQAEAALNALLEGVKK